MAYKKKGTNLRPPYLKKITFEKDKVENRNSYPFSLPIFQRDLLLEFKKPITIIAGENGSGKSTLLEYIAYSCGFNLKGGSRNHLYNTQDREPMEHLEYMNSCLKLAWLPKVSNGFFLRAETFYNFLEYTLDPEMESLHFNYGGNLLEKSHGEAFLTFFKTRLENHGVYLFDEPEAALSPTRQLEFLKILKQVEERRNAQIIMITHSPLLMAYPNADLLLFNHSGIWHSEFEQTDHFQLMTQFYKDPQRFIEKVLEEGEE